MSTSPRRLASCAMLCTALASGETAHAERSVEYLHVEASSGASGGGHAALRFADETYHYVYAEPGLIEATVEPNAAFDFAYRALGNRSIHVSRIATTDAEYEALEDAFRRRHITEKAQLDLLDAAIADRDMIAYVRMREGCASGAHALSVVIPRLRGAGYFDDANGADGEGGPDALASATALASPTAPELPPLSVTVIGKLAASIERAYGAGYLELRAGEIERDMRELMFVSLGGTSIAEGAMPARSTGFSERYEELASAAVAVDVLSRMPPAAPGAYRTLGGERDRVGKAGLAMLAARAESLRASLVRLVASQRRDWGRPMLIGLARLVALDASIRSGRFIVPDSFDDRGTWVDAERLVADKKVLSALLNERRSDLDTAHAELLVAPASDEAAWSRFEVATSAVAELESVVARGRGKVRTYGDTLLPSRSAELDARLPLPGASCEVLARWQGEADSSATVIRERLTEIYHYDVITRNCVTEIFRTIRSAGGAFATRADAESSFGFIPFVSAAAVDKEYAVKEHSMLPSYRAYWLARLRETDGPLHVALRESNVLTSTLRHPDDRDDIFMFYTDETVALRPLYGAINTGVGVGASAVGLAMLPFDGGRFLSTAVRSVVFSLPELAFVNFRKGRNGVLPRTWTVRPAGDS